MQRKIFLTLIALSLALLYAWSRIKVIEFGYDVSKAKNEIAETLRDNALLKSKVAQAKSTVHLADWAKRFGFVSPEAGKVLFVQE